MAAPTTNPNVVQNFCDAIMKRLEPMITDLNKRMDAMNIRMDAIETAVKSLSLELPKFVQTNTEQFITLSDLVQKNTKTVKTAGKTAEKPADAAEETEQPTPTGKKKVAFATGRSYLESDNEVKKKWLDILVAKNKDFVKEMEADVTVKDCTKETDKEKKRIVYIWNAISANKELKKNLDAERKAACNGKAEVANVEQPTPKE